MHPLLGSRDRLLIYFVLLLLVGLLLASAVVISGRSGWLPALLIVLPPTLFYGFIGLSAWYPCRSMPLSTTRRTRLVAIHLSGAFVSSALWLLLWRGWLTLLGVAPWGDELEAELVPAFQFLFIVGILLYLLSVAAHYLILAFEASAEAEQRALQYRLLANEAELKAFKAQIDPHFLFNSLNSISALCGSRPNDARAMSQQLGEFLRRSLRLGAMERVTLEEELDLVHGYLGIEQIRFGERLRIEETIDPGSRSCVLPPLLLQPLVENAVRHGISSMVEGGTVRIDARTDGNHVAIAIENDYDEESPASRGEGIGIQNVRGRLQSSFDGEGSMSIATGDGRFRVELVLPRNE